MTVLDVVEMRVLLNKVRITPFGKLKDYYDLERDQQSEEKEEYAHRLPEVGVAGWHRLVVDGVILVLEILAQRADQQENQ